MRADERKTRAKIAITGASGYIGGRLLVELAEAETLPISRRSGLDLRARGEIARALEAFKPDVVVHCANFGHPGMCERDPASALAVNVEASRELARDAERLGARFIYLSTDYVFGGESGAYRETDEPRPLNVFGRSKLAAERSVLESCSRALVLRTSAVYGHSSAKASAWDEWGRARLAAGLEVEAFEDVFSSPTYVDDVVACISTALASGLIGLYHYAGPERLSRYDFFSALARELRVRPELVRAVRQGDTELGLARPRDSSLLTQAALEHGMPRPRSIAEALPLCGYTR